MVWSALNEAVLHNDFDVSFIERKGVGRNVFRSQLSIPDRSVILRRMPLVVDRFMSVVCPEKEPFIFHSSYYRNCNNIEARKVVTVHDFSYERVKVAGRTASYVHHRQKMNAIRNADRIACVSDNTYNDLIYFYPDIDKRKVSIIYNGVSDEFRPLHTDYDDYVLFVGSRATYKNFEMAVVAVAQSGLRLIVCGNPLSSKEHKFLQKYLGNDFYIECVNADAVTLNQLYNGAFCLVYPSMYEGFGLPIVEAQKAGCPVVALNNSSIPEVIGNSPLLIKDNPIGAREIKNKLELLKNNGLRKEVVEIGLKNSSRFTIKQMQQQYIELYNSL